MSRKFVEQFDPRLLMRAVLCCQRFAPNRDRQESGAFLPEPVGHDTSTGVIERVRFGIEFRLCIAYHRTTLAEEIMNNC